MVERLPIPVQELEIDAGEYRFDIRPDPSGGLRPGWTKVTFRNVGGEAHQVMFARLKDGVDMAELAEAGPATPPGPGRSSSSTCSAASATSARATRPSRWSTSPRARSWPCATCRPPTASRTLLLGMSTVLQVSEATTDPAPVAPTTIGSGESPLVRGRIELAADGYVIPSPLESGWYHVENTDTDDPATGLHELSLLRLDRALDGDEVEGFVSDLAANRMPDVQVDAMGGLGAVSPGFDGYLYLDLDEGAYLAVDFMPDPGDPRPHMLDGYHASFRQ